MSEGSLVSQINDVENGAIREPEPQSETDRSSSLASSLLAVDQATEEHDPASSLISISWPDMICTEKEFDAWGLEYVSNELSEQLVCPICHCIFVEPYSTKCGHTFCHQCIQKVLESGQRGQRRCPIDRIALPTNHDIHPAAVLVTALVDDLMVFCPHKDKGCNYKNRRWLIESHVASDCPYTDVECSGIQLDGSKCHLPVERRYLSDERRDVEQYASDSSNFQIFTLKSQTPCVHRLVPCENNCGASVPKFQMDLHFLSCPQIEVACEACGLNVAKQEYIEHISSCPDVVVCCSFSKFGCAWSGIRSNLSTHLDACRFVDLAPFLSEQDKRIQRVESENQTLRFQVQQLTGVLQSNTSIDDNSSAENLSPDLLHVFMECERMRKDIDRLTTVIGEMEIKQSMVQMQETFRNGEEISLLRTAINGLRHQLHFLLTERRTWAAMHQPGAGLSSVASSEVPDGNIYGPHPIVYPRRLSDLSRQDVKL